MRASIQVGHQRLEPVKPSALVVMNEVIHDLLPQMCTYFRVPPADAPMGLSSLPDLDGYAYPFPHPYFHNYCNANCVVTSGGVSQMRGQPQSQTAPRAVLKGLAGALEQCRHVTASVGCTKFSSHG